MKIYMIMNGRIPLKAILITVLIAGPITLANAQVLTAISPSTWKISSHTDQSNNQDYNQSSIVKISSSQFSWGPSTNELMDFNISSETGEWNKEENTGTLELNIKAEGITGSIMINGDDNGMWITIDLSHEDGSSLIKLNVSQVEYN